MMSTLVSVMLMALTAVAFTPTTPLLAPSSSFLSSSSSSSSEQQQRRRQRQRQHRQPFAGNDNQNILRRDSKSFLKYSAGENLDGPESAKPLPLSFADRERFSDINNRVTTMPIIIMDTMLPGQKLHFQSDDPKFQVLIDYVLKTKGHFEVGILGMNPQTGEPMTIGVTAKLRKDDITFALTKNSEKFIATTFKGLRRFEIKGEPWMDSTNSFYVADVEIVENRMEFMAHNLEGKVMQLHNNIPSLVNEWARWLVQTEKQTPADLRRRLKDNGPMPKTPKERAIWVGALVNPIPNLGVCMEIRPALLSCQNDHDRMVLASTALKSSIDHLSGKQKLYGDMEELD